MTKPAFRHQTGPGAFARSTPILAPLAVLALCLGAWWAGTSPPAGTQRSAGSTQLTDGPSLTDEPTSAADPTATSNDNVAAPPPKDTAAAQDPAADPPATDPPTADPPAADPPAGGSGNNESAVVQLVNAERAKVANCPALRSDANLANAARAHSADMAAKGYFDHTGKDGRSFVQRIEAAKYTGSAGGENIAAGSPTPAGVMAQWMASPGHKANILNCSFKAIGVGVATGGPYRIYWTQDFGR